MELFYEKSGYIGPHDKRILISQRILNVRFKFNCF